MINTDITARQSNSSTLALSEIDTNKTNSAPPKYDTIP